MDVAIASCRASKSRTINSIIEGAQDRWVIGSQCIMKIHEVPRRCLFRHFQAQGAPNLSSLTSSRIAHGKFEDGETFMRQDTWACKTEADLDMGRPWTGRIVFIPRMSTMSGKPGPIGNSVTFDSQKMPAIGGEREETRSQLLTRKQQELFAQYLVNGSYDIDIRAQLLTRGWKRILQQHPVREQDSLKHKVHDAKPGNVVERVRFTRSLSRSEAPPPVLRNFQCAGLTSEAPIW